jgi:hypothetical protein
MTGSNGVTRQKCLLEVLARWLSYASFLLALLTMSMPNWIEGFFGVDPDHGGGLEA